MKKVDLAKFDNSDFYPGASVIKRLVWYFINILFFINPLNPSSKLKIVLLKSFGAIVAGGVVIKPNVNIKYPWFLEIGENSWIGEKVWIDNLCDVRLGANVCISQGALLLTGNHNYKKESFDLITGKIEIEDGVWVGAKSVITGGVKLKSHSIITAASVVSYDTEPYFIYKGNPAEKIRKREID
ncbi:MAG: WcaF family extracellular polysaccharide biosynthesis acetyltransferase [Melioribacteraceae bacterium]|nr:WcaF family extracellular polysaccharide biosynthesis acetyltransferase [Melioribacteraceae bacterium]MCF8262861.1 WcaF family extracellular polysaccharide biosynthesis acetyltransferase [Melioribacteraceae bacterium]MCF8414007.1 WcaF family extracellular polysaccharide biosynthesis acetyltransferase [Melioribacteraceae bacterium]MCF8430652.1 WcaF family extracellular polysaccharide biosynthesis acetyltransferase [Melioribacteraceae bacterium]